MKYHMPGTVHTTSRHYLKNNFGGRGAIDDLTDENEGLEKLSPWPRIRLP